MIDETREQTLPFNHIGFSHFLSEHRLVASQCQECRALFLPPRPMCTRCFGFQMGWQELSGEGELIGFTTVYIGLPALAAEGYNRDEPYCTGLIRLKEGLAIPGQILGFDCDHPEQITIGMPVQAAFIEKGAGDERKVYLAFRERKGILLP